MKHTVVKNTVERYEVEADNVTEAENSYAAKGSLIRRQTLVNVTVGKPVATPVAPAPAAKAVPAAGAVATPSAG